MSNGASVAILIALWFRENKYGKKLSEDVAEGFFFYVVFRVIRL